MATYLITKNGDPEPLGLSLYSPGAAAPYGQELFPFDCIDTLSYPFGGSVTALTRAYMIVPNGTFTCKGIATWFSVAGSATLCSVLYKYSSSNISLIASSVATAQQAGKIQQFDFSTPTEVTGDELYYIGFAISAIDTSMQLGYISGRLLSSATPFPVATDPNIAPATIGNGVGATMSYRPWLQMYGV